MYRFGNEKETEKVYFSQREFLNEKYSKLSAIQGSCSLETASNDNGKVVWVWGESELEISDGNKTVSISLGLDKDYEESLNRIDSIIDIATKLKEAFIKMKVDYDVLETEAKANRIDEKEDKV